MSQTVDGPSKGYVSVAALDDGTLVKLNASNQVVVATAATDAIIGATIGDCEAGEQVSVRLRSGGGTMKVRASAAIAVGAALTSDGDGEAVTTTTAGEQVVGFALEAASAADVLIEVLPSVSRY